MPSFKPNDLYGTGGYDMVLEDGSIYPDPFGELYKEHNPDPTGVLAQTAALTPAAPAGPDMRLAQNGPPDPASLMGSADPGKEAADFAAQFNPGAKPIPGEHGASGASGASGAPAEDPFALPTAAPVAGAAEPPDPATLMGSADPKPVVTSGSQTTTSSSTESSSSGLSDADQAKAAGDIDFVTEQKTSAANAQQDVSELEAQQALRRREELLAASAAGLEKTTADMVVQDKLDEEVEKKLRAGAEFKPDRTELFQGDRGALFGISAAISAMCGGWLMGMGKTGGRNPYLDNIMQIIDNNASDQIRKNSAVVQELLRQKGDIRAVKNELKARQARYVDQQLEARMLRDKSELIQSQGNATRAQIAADTSKWDAEQKRALMRTESKKMANATNRVVSSSTTTGKPVSGDKAQLDAKAKLRELYRIRANLRRGQQSGDLASVVGMLDAPATEVQRSIGTLPKGQHESYMALQDLQIGNLQRLLREPNPRAQEMVQGIGVPKSDNEIETSLRRLDELITDQEAAATNADVEGAPMNVESVE